MFVSLCQATFQWILIQNFNLEMFKWVQNILVEGLKNRCSVSGTQRLGTCWILWKERTVVPNQISSKPLLVNTAWQQTAFPLLTIFSNTPWENLIIWTSKCMCSVFSEQFTTSRSFSFCPLGFYFIPKFLHLGNILFQWEK